MKTNENCQFTMFKRLWFDVIVDFGFSGNHFDAKTIVFISGSASWESSGVFKNRFDAKTIIFISLFASWESWGSFKTRKLLFYMLICILEILGGFQNAETIVFISLFASWIALGVFKKHCDEKTMVVISLFASWKSAGIFKNGSTWKALFL